MDIALGLIDKIDWSGFECQMGSATDVGDGLRRLLGSQDGVAASDAWWGLENVIFAQDDIFSVAEPTVDVVLAALATNPPAHLKSRLLDLLFHILHGESVDDPLLSERCRARALRGAWLLVAEAASREGGGRETVLEILEMVDADMAALFG
jgi:hypothetical protein